MGLFGLTSCEKQLDMYGSPEPPYNDTTQPAPMYGVMETSFNG